MSGTTAAGLVVAFDLDMTLTDTVPGFASTLEALGGERGVELPRKWPDQRRWSAASWCSLPEART